MRNISKFILRILALFTTCFILYAPCAQAQPYQFKVRIFGGNQTNESQKGTPIWEQWFTENEECLLPREDMEALVAQDNKYYLKGFKISGEGGESACHTESFYVDHDYDFVAAYGISGQLVAYIVNYVDLATGEMLASPTTHYGNVGDKLVVAYRDIPGYQPVFRNITGTLTEGENVWTFPYRAVSARQAESRAQEIATGEAPAEERRNGETLDAEEETREEIRETTDEEDETEALITQTDIETLSEDETTSENTVVAEGIDLGGNAGILNSDNLDNLGALEDILDLDVPLTNPRFPDGSPQESPSQESYTSETIATQLVSQTTVLIVISCIVFIIIVVLIVRKIIKHKKTRN